MINSVSDLLAQSFQLLSQNDTILHSSSQQEYEGLRQDFIQVGDDIRRGVDEHKKSQ